MLLVLLSALPALLRAQSVPEPAPDSLPPVRFVEQMPEFRGNLGEWLAANLHYPDSARVHGVEGRCGIEFVVEKNGKVRRTKLVHSSGNDYLDAEAMRAIQSMPAWKPARQKGKAVAVIFTLPVSFKLD